MLDIYRLLIVNPGSTSTKIAIYDNEKPVFEETLRHSNEELSPYPTIYDQYEFRKNVILDTLNAKGINITKLNSVIGRGGLLNPLEGGTYSVNDKMLKDLKEGVMGEHASNLGGIIAHEIAFQLNIPAFIVDPVVVDELDDVARITGLPEINRISLFHALNQKAVAKRAARDLDKKYNQVNLIIAHLGGGISVGAHKKGKVVAVNNALDGEGPMSPERAGSLPIGNLIKLCFSGGYTQEEIKKKIVGKGGLVAHLNTNDGREISERIKAGDKKAELVYYAMAYQVAKEIGSCAAVLEGDVDAVCLTGGLAYDKIFIGWIKKKVEFISTVMVYPGEDEMVAMAQGALGVLREEEKAKVY